MQSNYSNDYLMQTLKFSPNDLAANKQGVLSPAQKDLLREKISQGQAQVGIIVALVMLIFFVVLGIYLFTSSEEGTGIRQVWEENPAILIVGIGGSLALYFIMIGYSLLRSQRMKSGDMNMKVNQISGKAKLKSSEMGYSAARAVGSAAGVGTRICTIKIGRTTMYTDEATFSAFQDGGSYRIYYVGSKRAPMIVAAEIA